MLKALFLPLLNADLRAQDKLNLGGGFSIERVPTQVTEKFDEDSCLAEGYKSRLTRIRVALVYRPQNGGAMPSVVAHETLQTSLFVVWLLRATTAIPFDCPWWFYFAPKGSGWGRTMIRTYRHGPDYDYVVNSAENMKILVRFRRSIGDVLARLQKYIDKPTTDQRVIRAIETASFGFQMKHIQPRLVNAVTFQETLFSSGDKEISHQVSERIA